jgi:glycosyltransferase involved in cell wall biosynthesis
MNNPQLTIIVTAYNEEASIGSVVEGLTTCCGDFAEIMVVNDGSTDRTAETVSAVNGSVKLISHKRNYGYGAALKTGIREASSEMLCFFDGDGQHDPQDVLRLYQASGDFDMVVGSRGRSAFLNLMRTPGKLILHILANFLAKRRIPDVNSGLRLVRREAIMRYLYLLPDGFSASTTMTMIFMTRGYEVKYIDIKVKPRKGKSQVHQLRDGTATIMLILRILLLFNPMRFFLPVSTLFIFLGVVYGAHKLYETGVGLSVGSLLIIFVGLLSFIFGLLCDQISSLRLERFESIDGFRRYEERGPRSETGRVGPGAQDE